MNALFGNYSFAIDESIHILLSLAAALIGFFLGLNWILCLISFLAGILIDLDHLLNKPLANLLNIKHYGDSH